MDIIINGQRAVMKAGTSFEYITENRDFSDADSYTLSITFPLNGVSENASIFGNLNYMQSDIPKNTMFDCEIIDANVSLFGVLTIVDFSETEVKAQFLMDRSVQNFDTSFDDVYIDELTLGYVEFSKSNTPSANWNSNDYSAVCIPWYNVDYGTILNDVEYINGQWSYKSDTTLCPLYYLIWVVKRVLSAAGYAYNLAEWENHDRYKFLLLCNALPPECELKDVSAFLPHWSVTEFLTKIEDFLNCYFDIDHKQKYVTISFKNKLVNEYDDVVIDDVVESFTSSVSEDDEEYYNTITYSYNSPGYDNWNFLDCPWFIEKLKSDAFAPFVKRYDTFASLKSDASRFLDYAPELMGRPGSYENLVGKVLYAADIDEYFMFEIVKKHLVDDVMYRRTRLLRINLFGSTEDSDVELDIVPANIDYVEDFDVDCLAISANIEKEDFDYSVDDGYTFKDENCIVQSYIYQIHENGSESDASSVFDKLFVAFWDGRVNSTALASLYYPSPWIDVIKLNNKFISENSNYSLRLNYTHNVGLFKPNVNVKYNFSFFSKTIPNPRALFYIAGKKYLCKKITATFTENGMSELLKGEFFRIE